jgi:hydroxymethylbilane synthase
MPVDTPAKGIFVKELEEALLEGRIDVATHSVKDLPTDLPPGLRLAAVLPREDPRDAFVARDGFHLRTLPPEIPVGVSSLRRQAQLKRLRRDLTPVPIRGNVDTRLKKLDSGEYGALILAACGLIRLGLGDRIGEYLDPSQMLPAPGQGAIGVEIRVPQELTAPAAEFSSLVQTVDDPETHWEIEAERALLKALGGGCQVPIGALARIQGETLTLAGVVLSPDGLKAIQREIAGPKRNAEQLGAELASHLRAAGADRLLYGHWVQKGQRTEIG